MSPRRGSAIFLASALLVGAVVCTSAQDGVTSSSQTARVNAVLSKLDTRLETERQKRNLPSISVAIVQDRNILYKRAFGYTDLDAKTPATLDTPYCIGSITKMMTTTAIMQLVERGLLRLDDPVVKYVPEYQIRSPFPGTQPTTIRQLASHTSGLPRDAPINFRMNYSLARWTFSNGQVPLEWYVSKEELLKSLPTVELEHRPNEHSYYSNLGVALLGMIVERVSGKSFEEYVRENIFAPLRMSNAGFIDDQQYKDADSEKRFPIGYVYPPGAIKPIVAPPWKLGATQYTGGVYATAEDLARFASLQFQDAPVGGPQILSGDSLRLMRRGSRTWLTGLGWFGDDDVAGHETINHNGGHVGFLASLTAIPDLKLAVVVLSNRYSPITDETFTDDIAKMLLTDLAAAVTPDKPQFDASKVDLQRYVGQYAVPGNCASMKVEFADGKLWHSVTGTPNSRTEMVPVGLDTFALAPATNAPALSFEIDANDKVIAANFALFRFKRVE